MPVDPRLLAAQRQFAQLQAARAPGIALSPMTVARAKQAQAAQAKEPQRPANPFQQVYQVRQQAGMAQKPDDGGGGVGGFFKDLGTNIVEGVGKVLSPLDYPRRFVLSGMKELADMAGDPGTRLFGNVTDEASWSDFMDQLKDPTFGFGDIVGDATGNEWLDRGIGLFGDIVADPLTYVTLGTTAAAGAGGRLALGGEAVAKNAAREAGEAGLRYGDEALERIAKYGQHGLSAAERTDLGLEKAGLRFGTHKANVRIPGTGQVATALGKGLGAGRGLLTDTAVGRTARRLGVSREPGTRAFTEAFVTGEGVGRGAGASTMRALTEQAADQNLTLATFAKGLRKDLKKVDGKTDLFHAVERGETEGTEAIRGFTKKMYDAQVAAGIPLPERQNYMPHYNTEAMEELLGRGGNDPDLMVPGIGGGSGRLNPRVFQPNSDVTIAGKTIHLDTATAEDITAKIHETFPEMLGKQLIEDDPGLVLPRLLQDASRDIGKHKFETQLQDLGQLRDQADPLVSQQGKLDEAASAAARAPEQERLQGQLDTLTGRREVMGREVQRRVAGAVDEVRTQGEAVLARSKELADQAQKELGKAGRGADYLRTELDQVATAGEEAMTQARTRLEALNQEADSIRSEVTASQGRMNRQRSAGYRQRMEAVNTERADLKRVIANGKEAAKQQDVVRKRLGRALAGQQELAAQVGEGPLGAERVAAGATLPQVAQEEMFGRAAADAAQQGQLVSQVEDLRRLRQDLEAIRQLAEEQAGRPVGEALALSREKSRLGGTPEGHARVVEEGMTTELTKKGARALTPGDRSAVRRTLKPEQLAEPNVLSDAVTNANDPDIVQAFYDTQQALTEALRPYRTEGAAGAMESAQALISPEDQALRMRLTEDIDNIEQTIRATQQRKAAGIEPMAQDRSLQSLNQERNKLARQRDEIRTTGLPRQVEAMDDMNVVELSDRAARMADYMVRYASGVAKGGDADAVGARAAREVLRSERDQVGERLTNRLPAERAGDREAGAFAAPNISATRERASAYELHARIQELAEPVKESARKLKRFQRLVESGRLNPGEMRDLLEADDINALLERGNVSVNAVESQLKTRVFEERRAFEDNMAALAGKRLEKPYVFAKRTTGETDRKMRDLLSQMTPKARGLWDNHLKQMSVLDNRRLRDLNERLTRMGETTAGREVTDKPYFALLEPPSALRNPDTALPAQDLSQMVDPSVIGDIEAQQGALATARSSRDTQIGAVEAELGQQAPMDQAVQRQMNYERQLGQLAAANTAQRGELGGRVADLSEFNRDLSAEVGAGRTARSELAARGTPDEEMTQRLQSELAPEQGRQQGLAENLGVTQGAAALAEERLSALPEQVGTELSATRSAYEAARSAQIEGAVQVAQTEQMVDQATVNLKKVRKYKTPKAVREGGDLTSAATDYENGVAQVQAAIGAGAPPEAVHLLDSAARISADMATVDRKVGVVNQMQEALKTDAAYDIFHSALRPGFDLFSSKTGTGANQVISSQLNAALEHMENILFREKGTLGKLIDSYTRFFKSYATATPGFHLRNAMSATFMNAADGVSAENMVAGVRAWKAFIKNPEGEWWKGLPERYRDVAQEAARAVYASGAGGAFEAAEIGRRAARGEGGRLKQAVTDNFWLKGSQRAGSRVEGSVRMGMAIDSMLGRGAIEQAGGTFSDAVSRINRIHFNYSSVGEWDEVARRAIPFWTFLSRNVPLQIQQMLIRPQTYMQYRSFQRNFESSPTDTAALPSWIPGAGGFALNPTQALMPDVGATQLAQSINRLASPSQMLSSLTPALKVPAQLVANKDFFYDEPYRENDFERLPPDLGALGPLFGALGLSQDVPGGGQAVERKYLDSTYDLLPPISWLNRLAGTTTDREGKQGQAWLNLLGVPVRNLTEEQLRNEAKRRKGQAKGAKSDDAAMREALRKLATAS